MPLVPGARLGPYEILGTLGAGGMGEVYRANDTTLGRNVAIKVLPDAFAHDAERLARFEREARTLATLNHPNIASIYGVDTSGSSHALVMELVEGPTLADRLVHGPLALDEALTIAKQIAEALEAAHDHGIVHRDLKPANIKVRPDGTVKVLDFGLAKTLEAGDGAASHMAGGSLSPTITTPAMTQIGMILGTAAYMSPEQARGQSVDRASDIWAFGCVLYEMLGGRVAFSGETITDVLGGIVRVDPDWTTLPADTPDSIRTLVRRCLRKDRKRRLKDIADARVEIEEVLAEGAGSAVTKAPSATPAARSHARLAIAIGALVLIVIAGLVPAILYFREPAPDDRVIRFGVTLPPKATAQGAPPAISPDGRRLAFVASQAGRTQIWIRPIDSTVAQPLVGTEDADYLFWSPDSRFIAFFSNGKLRKIDASGGPPQAICDAPFGLGGAWNQDGVIVFAGTASGALYRVASTGGIPVPATAFDASAGEISHRSPAFLPDGRRFLFFVQGADNATGIHIGSLDSTGHRLLLNDTSSGVYIAPGYLLFVRDLTLMAQRLDIETLTVTGNAIPIAESVGTYASSASTFSVSANGVLAYSRGNGGVGSDRQLAWFDRDGRLVESIQSGIPFADVALSPDGKQAVLQWTTTNQDIWVLDLVRAGISSRLTSNTSIEDYPVWSPEGARVLYTSAAGGRQDLYSKLASGAGSEDEVLKSPTQKRPTDWSSRFILYDEDDPKTQSDLWALPLVGEKKPLLVLRTPFSEQQGRLSPDGKWIAYVSNETGPNEVYVQSFPPSAGKWKVSNGGGVTPRWRRDGRELFYLALNRTIMSVDVRTGATFEHETPKALFEAPVDGANTFNTNRYDVSADGQRFLVNAPMENASPVPITIVVNWLAALKNQR